MRDVVIEDGLVVFRTRELAAAFRPPAGPVFDATCPPCDGCGKPVVEVLLTTGGAWGDPELWRDVPLAVDGWACTACGTVRYPRPVTADHIMALEADGLAHANAGRYEQAELAFARMVWDWPGYFSGHINYAEVTRMRLASEPWLAPEVRAPIVARMRAQYEAAIAAHEAEPDEKQARSVAHAREMLTRSA
ncbi:MAG TPA: hypothetical protein VGM88_06740 [Kofleriaceae bacterium]|jgi:hypothetical protein